MCRSLRSSRSPTTASSTRRDAGSRVALARNASPGTSSKLRPNSRPFIITPHVDDEGIKRLLRVFADEHARERIGLTDGSIIDEARRLKEKYGAGARVHIWTKDRRLKAHEPDEEPDPFVV